MPAKVTQARRALGTQGRRLYDAVMAEYTVSEHELQLLLQACRTCDVMAELQKQVDKDGPLLKTDFEGPPRTHPALRELRSQRATYMALVKLLGLPVGVAGEAKPPRVRATKYTMGKLRGLPGGA